MSALTTNPPIDTSGSAATAVRSIGRWLLRNSTGARCAAEVRRLAALSDGELSRVGLRRDDIVRHVFEPHFYR